MSFRLGEVLRKTIHIAGVLIVPILLQFGSFLTSAVCFAFAAGLYVYPTVARYLHPTPFGIVLVKFKRLLNFLERKGHPRYEGAILFFVSVGAISLLFPIKIALLSIVVLSIGDGVSTLAGRAFGRTKLFHNSTKSWEGSLSGFVVSSFVCALFVSPLVAIIASFIGMLVESLNTRINDNVSVPFAVAIVSYGLSYFGLLLI